MQKSRAFTRPDSLARFCARREFVEEQWRKCMEERDRERKAVLKQGWLWKIAATGLSAVETTVAASHKGEQVWCALSATCLSLHGALHPFVLEKALSST
jgi:hypothetical protein